MVGFTALSSPRGNRQAAQWGHSSSYCDLFIAGPLGSTSSQAGQEDVPTVSPGEQAKAQNQLFCVWYFRTLLARSFLHPT